jgi:hypothetical protein
MNPMGRTSIASLPNRRCFSEGIVGTRFESSQEGESSCADVGHQISAMMLRYELLLGIVAACEHCSSNYRQKISESSGLLVDL